MAESTDTGMTDPAQRSTGAGRQPTDTVAGSGPEDGTSERALERAFDWLDGHGDEPLSWTRSTGESGREHGRGIEAILRTQGADSFTRLIGLLACSQPVPPQPRLEDWLGPQAAVTLAELQDSSIRLLSLTLVPPDPAIPAGRHQAETLRRMTMAMARDVRVVMVRLASGLQTLRRLVAGGLAGLPESQGPANEALAILAPLANRLGLFRLKWEMEDLAFRCSQPQVYHALARQLEAKRAERERFVAATATELARLLGARGIDARVTGRPKHLYSIHAKLQNKQLTLDRLHDLRAVRVLVTSLADCYAALDVVHQRWEPQSAEFDDYIARPKPNGYQSLHTVVRADDGQTLEVQIRTHEMHAQAEYGIAAHWRYKERIGPHAANASAAGTGAGMVDQAARLAWLRQLLAWQQEVDVRLGTEEARTTDDSRIFVMTPQGRVIELPAGATPIDFAYHVHSSLGHVCRGAKVDGRMVSLNTALANGQVVDITAARGAGPGAGAPGPSRDWLNPALGFLRSPRARSKVRQWFNAQDRDSELAAGRERVEKALAREGRTSLSLDELAVRLGQPSAAAMFAEVARETIGARALEDAIRSPTAGSGNPPSRSPEELALPLGDARGGTRSDTKSAGNAVLVVGVDFLLTQLARCCHPAPPDPIIGFVTRGKGVTIHREGCVSFRHLSQRAPERILPASWGEWDRPARSKRGPPIQRRYPVGLQVHAIDRPGLLRDMTEVLARERVNLLSVRSNTRGDLARFNFVVEVASTTALERVLSILRETPGVERCTRN